MDAALGGRVSRHANPSHSSGVLASERGRRPASSTRDQSSFRVLPTANVGETTARFRKVNEDNLNGRGDALEFPSGEIVLLKRLCEG